MKYNKFLGYHSSKYDLDGLEKGEVLDEDNYHDLIRGIYIEFISDSDEAAQNDDIEAMNEYFEENGYGFTFVSDEPIKASAYQYTEYKYGDNLYKVYGTGKELLYDDPNELNATIVVSKEPLYFKKVELLNEGKKVVKLYIKESQVLKEFESKDKVFYHGSTDRKIEGKRGIHVGTKLAATQALEARIGVPSKGEWDGTRKYGETLLAGKKRLKELEKERGYYLGTGYNAGRDVPEDDYYPSERNKRAVYSDGTQISFNSRPIVFPVKIIGQMTNSPAYPHSDMKANSMMMRNLKMGDARRGYYYVNDGEDEGSISAVVPDGSFLKLM